MKAVILINTENPDVVEESIFLTPGEEQGVSLKKLFGKDEREVTIQTDAGTFIAGVSSKEHTGAHDEAYIMFKPRGFDDEMDIAFIREAGEGDIELFSAKSIFDESLEGYLRLTRKEMEEHLR